MTPTPARDEHNTFHDGVLVVGGGYAGVHAAQAVAAEGVAVTVVNPTEDYDFVPRLSAVAAGAAPAGDATAPLADLVERVVLGTAVRIGDGEVELDDGRILRADAVIVTAGARPVRPPVEGIEHGWPLRTSTDALALRHALAAADSLVVVGGGATGVQLAGAARAQRPDLHVSLADREPQLLSPMDRALSEHAERVLRNRGVELYLGREVQAIEPDGVLLDGDERVAGLVAWAAGFEGRADDLGLEAVDNGRIVVNEHLRVVGTDRTFAAGDIAAHLDGDGAALPMSAQIAVQAGAQAGRNAARLILGRALQRPSLAQRGWVLDLGGGRGVAALGPIPLPVLDRLGALPIARDVIDRLAPLLHDAVDLKHLQEIGGLTAIRRFRPGAARPI